MDNPLLKDRQDDDGPPMPAEVGGEPNCMRGQNALR